MNPDDMNPEDGNPNLEDDDLLLPDQEDQKNRYVFPNGAYPMVCVGIEDSVSQSGNKQLVWLFRGGEEVHNGQFKSWTVRHPNALWKITRYCEALGLAKGGEAIKISQIKEKCVGRRCMGVLKQETKDGQTRSNLVDIKPHKDGPGEGRSSDPSDLPF